MKRATMARIGGCSLLVLLAGCMATKPPPPVPPATGDASWREVAAPGTVRYQLAMGDVSSGGTPFKRVAPIYPVGLLAACPPPQEVQALLIVGDKGEVSEVRVADESQADASRRAFIAAVRVAAMQWEFNPLTINHWAADKDGAPTTDPQKAIEGMLLPAAGPKGFGLAFMVDLLTGGLSGGNIGAEVNGLYGNMATPYRCSNVFIDVPSPRRVARPLSPLPLSRPRIPCPPATRELHFARTPAPRCRT